MAGSPLKLDLDAFRTPIAAALVLAPPVLIVGSPLPIIGVDLNASIRGVGISLFGAPAVARTIANDGCRRRCCTKNQKANGHQDRTSEMFHCCLLKLPGRAVKRIVSRLVAVAGKGRQMELVSLLEVDSASTRPSPSRFANSFGRVKLMMKPRPELGLLRVNLDGASA